MSEHRTTRPTGGDAYRNGKGAFYTENQRIEDGQTITTQLKATYDACVIGSGAGGAVMAKELAEAGMSVAVLEEGRWFSTDEFTAKPREMMISLFRDTGQVLTVGRPSIPLPHGKAVGGTTLINTGTCFRTPKAILNDWQTRLGLEALSHEELDPYFRRVERILNVSQVPPELAGENTNIVIRGSRKLGYSGDYIYRNVRGCIGSNICNYGCPSGAKQHSGISYIPQAWDAGAVVYTCSKAKKVHHSGRTVTGVTATTTGGGSVEISCKYLFVACGTVYTPLFLKQAGITSKSGQLGRNLSIHPATAARALFDYKVESDNSVPQSYYVDEFADHGVMLEGSPTSYELAALALGSVGSEHRQTMLSLDNYARFAMMISDSSRGTVRSAFGTPLITYNVNKQDVEKIRLACKVMAEIYWAAGAREINLPIVGMPTLKDGDIDSISKANIKAKDLKLFGFHPLGTAQIGQDPTKSVVDQNLRMHGFDNLYITDGSVVPTSIGVNPMVTIMALATRCAYQLTDQSTPEDEPYPEHIAEPRVKNASL